MKKIFTLFLFVITIQNMPAQFNPLESQYMLNPLVLNPAYAGARGFLSTTLSYRRQWVGFEGAPETYAFTLHTPLRNKHFSVGLLASQDNIAVLHQTHVEIMYAYRIIAKKFSLSAGFSPGIYFMRNNWGDIQTTTGNDNVFQSSEAITTFGAGFGLYLNSKRFFFGISNRALFSQKGIPPLKNQPVLAYTGYTIGNSKDFALTISVLGRYILNNYYQADINMMASFHDRFFIGASYRPEDAVVGILQFKLNEQFYLGYSYDFTLSRLKNYSSGTHELVLRYDFGYRINAKSPRTL
jgi:type IX secretion system PorP/SprF family membrane protein